MTGARLVGTDSEKTRSGRDMAIIYALISNRYNYSTIRSIFINEHLSCSDRILEEGEKKLKWDVMKALEFLNIKEGKTSKEQQKILDIKLDKYLKAEEKRIEINSFIVEDLLSGTKPVGRGFRDGRTC